MKRDRLGLHSSIEEVMAEVEPARMTRVQKERPGPVRACQRESAVCSSRQRSSQRQSQYEKVLHPLPRVDEIATDVV